MMPRKPNSPSPSPGLNGARGISGVKPFTPDLNLLIRAKSGRDTPVEAERFGDWSVTPCLCGLCEGLFAMEKSDVYTVTHIASTGGAAQHLGLSTARQFAAAMDKQFPKFSAFDSPIVPKSAHIARKLYQEIVVVRKGHAPRSGDVVITRRAEPR